jgi:hypothetical protein
MHRTKYSVLALAALAGCSKSDSKSGGGDGKSRSAPFAVDIHEVETLKSVAPNETWEKQGLGSKAGDGETFVCIQYTATNNGDKPEGFPLAELVDTKGTAHQPDTKAAGNYQPADWVPDRGVIKVEPKTAIKKAGCFLIAEANASTLKMQFVDTGWGKNLGWRLEVDVK